jgi:hypothetical protein
MIYNITLNSVLMCLHVINVIIICHFEILFYFFYFLKIADVLAIKFLNFVIIILNFKHQCVNRLVDH